LEESVVLDEKDATTAETLMSFEAKDFAELIAAAVDSVMIGDMLPLGSMVPVMVVITGPSGLSEVITEVVTIGRGNWVEGKGAEVEDVVLGGIALEPLGAGGIVGIGIGGKPGSVALEVMGDQAAPPGPTTIEVTTPPILDVIVVVSVSVAN
jgi:hypothetical protein